MRRLGGGRSPYCQEPSAVIPARTDSISMENDVDKHVNGGTIAVFGDSHSIYFFEMPFCVGRLGLRSPLPYKIDGKQPVS